VICHSDVVAPLIQVNRKGLSSGELYHGQHHDRASDRNRHAVNVQAIDFMLPGNVMISPPTTPNTVFMKNHPWPRWTSVGARCIRRSGRE
jgi:hypothetical protein